MEMSRALLLVMLCVTVVSCVYRW